MLIPLRDGPMLSANVVYPDDTTPPEWKKSKVFTLDGVKLGVVGFTTEATPSLLFPGKLGPFEVRPVVPAVKAEASGSTLTKVGAILAIGHEGATAGTVTDPTGPLVDIADALTRRRRRHGRPQRPAGHLETRQRLLLTENRARGSASRESGCCTTRASSGSSTRPPTSTSRGTSASPPDPAIQALINDLNTQLGPIFSTVIGSSTVTVPRADSCGTPDGRRCESKIGNTVTDAMRTTYMTDFAITNSGGLRADLTCPAVDNSSDFCPAFTPPPFPITRGQVLGVLPFGNIIVTLSVNGAELKTMLENGVSAMPAINGRFAQVSGLCFTYNITAAVGSRVTGAVRQAADGTCTGAPVDLTAASTYSIAENDFMVAGGDGYPVFSSRAVSQEIMDEALADYVTANTPISPSIQGRITCVGATCPVVTP